MAGVLAVVLVVGASGGADGRPLSGAELYRQLADAARAGDPEAAEYKGLLDDHLRRTGLGVARLRLPTEATTVENLGEVQLTVRDAAPWGITISNSTALDTPEAIAGYRVSRHAALAALASAEEGRRVSVVASPGRPMGLQEFVGVLSCPCAAEQIVVDIYDATGGWLMSSVRDVSGMDMSSEAAAIEAAVLDQAGASIDQFPGVERAELSANVRSVRFNVAANDALEASRHPDVLIVDPLTDIADAYAGRAALIDVNNPPDIWEAYARLVLGAPVDRSFIGPAGE